jgi:hypothetical protein
MAAGLHALPIDSKGKHTAMKRLTSLALLLGLLSISHSSAEDTIVELEVQAGEFAREHTPVFLQLPDEVTDDRTLVMQRVEDKRRVGVQRVPGDKPTIAWMIEKPLPAGVSRKYRLIALDRLVDRVPTMVTAKQDEGRIAVSVLGEPVLTYNHAEVASPDGIDAVYSRSGYIHPIYNPAGQSVTGDFPADHPHQHALFLAWVNTSFADSSPDFWNQAGKNATIKHHKLLGKPTSGSVFASFNVQLEHAALSADGKSTAVLHENWQVRIYRVKGHFLFDLISRQTCAGDTPLTIKQHHYGGLAIRGSQQWYSDENSAVLQKLIGSKPAAAELAKAPLLRNYLTSEGKTWFDGNQTAARWVDMHGPIDGKPTGMTVLCHPDNFRSPQKVRLHPTKPYFCFAPMSDGDFTIEAGMFYVSRYRFFVHNGAATAAASERVWNDYAHPPNVLVVNITDK